MLTFRSFASRDNDSVLALPAGALRVVIRAGGQCIDSADYGSQRDPMAFYGASLAVRFGRLLPAGVHRGQAIVYTEASPSGEYLGDMVIIVEPSPACAGA